jgi:DNA adenine methylase
MGLKHPVLKYYGGKFRIAEWVIRHFPKHRHYVEPFGGAASVLLVKEPSTLETYNDLDGRLVNFFRVLRERPDELVKQINLTPWSRREYEFCLTGEHPGDDIENARRLYFRLWMNFQGSQKGCPSNWRRHKNGRRALAKDVKVETLFEAAERFKLVQLENRDALKLIREFDSPDTLFYLDPPYLVSTRTTKKVYSFEMADEKHREFAKLLYGLKGHVVVSGYPSPLYSRLFELRGWKRFDREALIMGGGKRTECLWLHPRTARALKKS